MKTQSLKQIFKVTEWRDGCVFKTKSIGFAWVTVNHNPPHDGNLQFHSVSTDTMRQLGHKTIRSVSDDKPDMDITTLEQEMKGR